MSGKQQEPDSPDSVKPSFFAELKRRKVVRVAITYAVVAWLIIQIAATTFEGFGIPEWAFRFVTLMVILGFPVALIITWAFELTPEGVKLTKTALEDRQGAPVSTRQERKRNWFALGFAAAVPAVIFGILALVFYVKFRNAENRETTAQTSQFNKSIAVLPLGNMSPDPANAFFADGVHEDILTNLSKVRELLVISRTSTLGYKDTTRNLREIGAELGVRYLVEGSVRRAGEQVRVTVQLIDATNDEHLWAQSYDRRLDDIFAIQSEIAQKIAGQLQAAISPEEVARIERRPTDSLEAYDYFLKARQLIETAANKGDEKIALLEMAVAADPDFAEAWAQLAVECIWWWDYDKHRSEPGLVVKAHHAYDEAERLGSGLPQTAYARAEIAWFEHRDLEASIRYLQEALAIDPGYHTALNFSGWRNEWLGRMTEAQFYYEAALRVDPLSRRTNVGLAYVYGERGRWDKARALIKHNLERTDGDDVWQQILAEFDYFQTGDKQALIAAMEAIPGVRADPYYQAWFALQSRDYQSALQSLGALDSSRYFGFLRSYQLPVRPLILLSALIRFELGEQEGWMRETDSARNYLEGVVEGDSLVHPYFWSCLTICHALAGEREQMEASMAKVREMTRLPAWRYFYQAECELHLAIAYLVLGDNNAAIEILTLASKMDGGMPALNRRLDLWFIFDRLRGDPRFDALLEN